MKEFGLFGLDGQLPTLDAVTTAAEKIASDEAISQHLSPIKEHEYDGISLFGWGTSTEQTETQQQATGDARPEIGQGGETIFTNSTQYVEHFREPDIPLHSGYSSEQYARVFERNKTSNNT